MGELGGKKLHMATLLTGRGHEEIPQGTANNGGICNPSHSEQSYFFSFWMYTCHGRYQNRSGKKSSHACSRSRGTIPGTVLLHEMSAISDASTRLANLGVPPLS